MLNNQAPISIRFADEFENNLYSLSKKYRNIRKDIVIVLEQIQASNFIGDRLLGLGENYVVMKFRVKNSNIQREKVRGIVWSIKLSRQLMCRAIG